MSNAEYSKAWRLRNPEKAKASTARWREKNKERCLEDRRRWVSKNPDKAKEINRRCAYKCFFKNRARMAIARIRHSTVEQIANDIFWLWHKQRGRCALTGMRLDRTAELDHIIPVSQGGKNERSNLQWLCKKVNRSKRDLTSEEFISLCKEVISYKQ